MPDGCVLKSLPEELLIVAAANAVALNPANAPNLSPPPGAQADAIELTPYRAAALTGACWPQKPTKISVSFMEKTSAALQDKILLHMNAWATVTCIEFIRTNGVGSLRISRGPGGYYSYLGTQILSIPKNQPTMNLEGFELSTPDAEYRRVVRHETGHSLAMPHDHQRKEIIARLDRAKTYAYFLQTSGWGKR